MAGEQSTGRDPDSANGNTTGKFTRDSWAKQLARKKAPLDGHLDYICDLIETTGLPQYRLIEGALQDRLGNVAAARAAFAKIESFEDVDADLLYQCRDELSNAGRHDGVVRGVQARYLSAAPRDERSRRDLNRALFVRDAGAFHAEIAAEIPIDDPAGYVVVTDLRNSIATALMVPLAVELRRVGYEVVSLVAGQIPVPHSADLDGIAGAIRSSLNGFVTEPHSMEPANDWTIDWPNREISCDGIHYFTYFEERMATFDRSFRPDMERERNRVLFEQTLRRSDLVLTLCKQLQALAERTGKPIRIAAMDTHFAPYGIARKWCEVVGHRHDIHLVALSVAYENYYSNLSTKYATAIALEDLTARRDLRHPLLGGKTRFDAFKAGIDDQEALFAEAMAAIRQNRSNTGETDAAERAAVLDKIAATRAAGGRVFCAFGKVLIDFAAPEDRGHVFGDMKEWIQFLAREIEGTGNLLLIKPHPHELRPEIVMDGCEQLRDSLPDSLPDTVHFLGHSAFNSYEVAEKIDCAFIWNGTISVEFPVLRCPVVAESIYGDRDYPIGNLAPASLEDYRSLLSGRSQPSVSDAQCRDAAAFLRFMSSPEVAIPYSFFRRSTTNRYIGRNTFYPDEVRALFKDRDPHVHRAARRFLDG